MYGMKTMSLKCNLDEKMRAMNNEQTKDTINA